MKLDPRHLGAVLAGLRLVQQQMKPVPNGSDVDEILTNGDTIEPLDLEEINQLCERLNFSPVMAVGDKPQQGGGAAVRPAKVLAKMIRSFRVTSRNEEHTDTERAWELLNAAEKALRATAKGAA